MFKTAYSAFSWAKKAQNVSSALKEREFEVQLKTVISWLILFFLLK